MYLNLDISFENTKICKPVKLLGSWHVLLSCIIVIHSISQKKLTIYTKHFTKKLTIVHGRLLLTNKK